MEFYSHKTYKAHLSNMKRHKEVDKLRGPYLDWCVSIANIFERSYPRIGVLDLTDLLQEAYVSFYKAWPKLDNQLLEKQPTDAQRIAIITNYMKLNLKNGVRRAIARDRETIRIPESHYSETDPSKQTDIFLTQTFSAFFESHLLDIPDEVYDYENEKLNKVLTDQMNDVLSSVEKQVLCMFFGIDEPYDIKKSVKDIANWFGKSEIWVKKIKAKALNVMKLEENKKILENKVLNVYTF
jgi:DNA-directed RNA polymerase specialized sigma subunit